MRINSQPADGDLIHSAFLSVLCADVVSRAQKRGMMARLAGLKDSQGCPPNACEGCTMRSACEADVLDIIGSG